MHLSDGAVHQLRANKRVHQVMAREMPSRLLLIGHWGRARQRRREGVAAPSGRPWVLAVLEGLPRATLAEVMLQLNVASLLAAARAAT